jgi:membrane-associated phospholipid phosphatase
VDLDQGQQARASLGRDSVLNRPAVERAALTAAACAFFTAGYFGVGLNVDPPRARSLGTAVDLRIPFIASSVWVYLSLFPTSLLPLFVVRCPRLFRRTIAAYVLAIAASLAVFAVFPVTSAGLRADPAALDATRFAPWAVALLYRLDPPYNLFPSLHLSIAILAALSAWKASRPLGTAAFAGVAPIGASICTVKQHFIVDGAGGVALAAIV